MPYYVRLNNELQTNNCRRHWVVTVDFFFNAKAIIDNGKQSKSSLFERYIADIL